MATVRRGAGAFLRFFVPLLALLVLVQIFLAGFGAFGIEEGQGLEEAGSLDPHRVFGHVLSQPGALLLLLASLLWWPADKRRLGLHLAAAVLLFLQVVLAIIGGQFVGGLHAFNAVLVLGLLGSLAYRHWRPLETADVAERREVT